METPENELNLESAQEQPQTPENVPALSDENNAADTASDIQEAKPFEEPIHEIPQTDTYQRRSSQGWGFDPRPEVKGNTQKIDVQELNNQNDQIDLVTVCGVRFESFEEDDPVDETPQKNLDIMQDITMTVTVELGRTKSSVKKVLDMTKGSIVELEKVAGEPVELFVNGKLIGYGEVIVMEEKFGLRVTNIAKPKTLP